MLKVIENAHLLLNVQQRGQQLISGLKNALSSNPHVLDVRGRGLMIGIEIDKSCGEIMQLGLKHGILFNVVRERVIRLLPPFILSENEAQQLIERLTTCINEFLKP